MTEYYLDIETTGLNPSTDKIITIQFQRLRGGEVSDDLVILKEWKSSEVDILREFNKKAFKYDPLCNRWKWDFIPVGDNLLFDLAFISKRMLKLGIGNYGVWYLSRRPRINLESVMVLMNNGEFRGYTKYVKGLSNFVGKDIPELYKQKRFDEIEAYIKDEAEAFLRFYRFTRIELKLLGDKYEKA